MGGRTEGVLGVHGVLEKRACRKRLKNGAKLIRDHKRGLKTPDGLLKEMGTIKSAVS